MARNFWDEVEDKLLRETYPVSGITGAVAVLPGRSETGVISRAKHLGLSRSGTGKMKEWTGRDEMVLLRLWRNGPKQDIEEYLPNRSWKSIMSKAHKLRLIRNMYVRQPIRTTGNSTLDKIRLRMNELGMTSTDIQVIAGLQSGCVRNWFNSKAEPKLCNVIRVVIALGGEVLIKWDQENGLEG